MNGFETLIFEKSEGIAHVTLNRPQVLNAMNTQMRDDLYEVLRAIRDDDEIRVVILRGKGDRAFCAGADLSEFLSAPSPTLARRTRMVRDLWGLFLKTRQPLVAALHGYVLGSGLEMALCCDVRIADQNAIFGLPEVNLGMIPAAGGTQTLPRAIGRSKATEILLTGSKLSSAEALSCGLVHYVVETAELMQAAEAKARKIAEYDLAAARFAKEAVLQGSDMDLDQGLQLERRLSLRLQTGRH